MCRYPMTPLMTVFMLALSVLTPSIGICLSVAEMRCMPLSLPVNAIIETTAVGDVLGNGARDFLYLVGLREQPDSQFAARHALYIRNGVTGTLIPYMLEENSSGYPGTLQLADITGDKVPEILIGLPTGGSGGIVQYHLLSAQEGRVVPLIDTSKLTAGAQMTLTLRDNYRAEFTYPPLNTKDVLNLKTGKTPRELRDTYAEVYRPTGKLITPTSGVIDPYGVLTAVDANRDGVYDLEGFQSAWVIYHANTIATVQSRWQWRDNRLTMTEVAVTRPSTTPANYRAYLRTLGIDDPQSVGKALDAYRRGFTNAPPLWRDEALLAFRDWHQRVIARENVRFQMEFARVGSATAAFEAQRQYAEAFTISARAEQLGAAAVYIGEGLFEIRPREYFYLNRFRPYLTPMAREYLILEQREVSHPWEKDAAITITRRELGRILRGWEQYLENHPDTLFAKDTQRYYHRALDRFLYGSDNSLNYDSETLAILPEVREAFRWYRASHPDTLTASRVETLERLYMENDDRFTPQVETATRTLQALHDPNRAASYYPLLAASQWRYPIGGFENAGFTTRVTFRQGIRAQTNRQNTGALAIHVYETRPSAVVQVYREAEASTGGNRLDKISNSNFAVIAEPIMHNAAWVSDGRRNVIRAVGQIVNVLGRTYPETIVVVRTPITPVGGGFTITDYYALGVGLIKSTYQSPELYTETLLCNYYPGQP